MYIPQRHTGTLTGTGSNLEVLVGYKPDYVEVLNVTQHTTLKYINGKNVKIASDGTQTNPSDAITVSERGFTVKGSEAANNDELVYICIG